MNLIDAKREQLSKVDVLNMQQILDYTFICLLEQGCKSTRPRALEVFSSFGCAYQNPSGERCAMGWLIRAGAYTTEMEGKGIEAVRSRWNRALRIHPNVPCNFLRAVQATHDNYLPDGGRGRPKQWKLCMKSLWTALAHEYKLNADVMNTV